MLRLRDIVTSPLASGATAIGRYFTVVSFVPSTVFVAYILVLVRSGAFEDGAVDIPGAFSGLDLADAAILGIASLLVGLALHPLQHTLIQLFEGYWGTGRLGRFLALQHVLRHRERAFELRRNAYNLHAAARPEPKMDERNELQPQQAFAKKWDSPIRGVSDYLGSGESFRRFEDYPPTPEAIMPTRLGNVLRKYEMAAGARYGLDAITLVPRLMQVAPARDVAYVDDQRTQMELALRVSVLALVASAVTIAAMWRHDLWLLVSLVPYALAYASYRGAVVIAHEYGMALASLVDLNRFALYERMHLPHPKNTHAEQRQNRHLGDLLRLDNAFPDERDPHLTYAEPPPAPVWPPPPPTGEPPPQEG